MNYDAVYRTAPATPGLLKSTHTCVSPYSNNSYSMDLRKPPKFRRKKKIKIIKQKVKFTFLSISLPSLGSTSLVLVSPLGHISFHKTFTLLDLILGKRPHTK